MKNDEPALPEVVTRDKWLLAREEVRTAEEELARQRAAMTARWRDLPMLEMARGHVFEGADGKVSLVELFEGMRQLLVYHFWFEPGEDPCEGCSLWTRDLGDLGGDFASLHQYETTLAYVSRASSAEIEEVKARRGWAMPWYSLTGGGFADATGYDGWAQISVFVRKGDSVYLTNVVAFEDLVTIGNHWTLLDRAPLDLKYNKQ